MRRSLSVLVWALLLGVWSTVGVAQRPATAFDGAPPDVAPLASAAAETYAITFDALVALTQREYWDAYHLDWQAWAAWYREEAVNAPDRVAFDAVMRRMVLALGDEHSSWSGLPPAAPAPAGGAGGASLPPRLGAQFSFAVGRGLVVERVYPDTPAAAAGLRRGDVIVAIGAAPLATSSGFADANAVLTEALTNGPVPITVERRRMRLEIEVSGAAVPFGSIVGAPYATMLDDSTGYLKVPSFNDAGVGELAHRALADLREQGAVALVLDLRENYGGRLVEAGVLLGAFIEGTWADAVTRGRGVADPVGDEPPRNVGAPLELAWRAMVGRERGDTLASLLVTSAGEVMGGVRVRDASMWRGPVVVLVGAETVSAGEVVALALQDQGRARVVGERTAGNVEAVHAFTLPDGSRVMLAVADLRGPHGLIYANGVVPDVVARAQASELARGIDAPVVEARRLLGGLPFTPDRRF